MLIVKRRVGYKWVDVSKEFPPELTPDDYRALIGQGVIVMIRMENCDDLLLAGESEVLGQEWAEKFHRMTFEDYANLLEKYPQAIFRFLGKTKKGPVIKNDHQGPW